MASAIKTTDHDEIRKWVEAHGGRPAHVRETGDEEEPGILRIDFDEDDEGLEEIGWDAWFAAFEANDLAFLYAPETRFNKLVARD